MYAFPSYREGLSVALMEAMSVGLPVVCSRIRGNTDLIEDGKGGFLFNPHDVDGFATGMNHIISGDCKQMRDINIGTMQKFDIATVNKKMSDIYRNI